MDNFFLDTMMSGRKNGGIFISLAFALFIVCSCTGTDNTVVTVEEDPEVGEASNTGCIDRTRAAASDKQTIVLRKEGDVISCELDNCVGNCSTS